MGGYKHNIPCLSSNPKDPPGEFVCIIPAILGSAKIYVTKREHFHRRQKNPEGVGKESL